MSKFAKMKVEEHSRIIMAVHGDEDSGKTHFSLTAPDPIAYINSDIGHEGVVDKFIEDGKDIRSFDFAPSGSDTQAQWEEEWEDVVEAYEEALRSSTFRTVIWDTETDLWLLGRLAEFGRESSRARNYGPLNKEYKELITKAYYSDKNLIMIQRNVDEYVDDKTTGNRKAAGFKQVAYLAQVSLSLWRYEDGGDFGLTVEKCRKNPFLVGEEFEAEMCNFDIIASLSQG